MVAEARSGKIEAVLLSPNHGYPTFPQPFIEVTMEGVNGDAHSGPMRESYSMPGTFKPNDRQVSFVADEVREKTQKRFGLVQKMGPGGFNEQVLTSGLGDLSDAEEGDVISSGEVTFTVVARAVPCEKLDKYHGEPHLSRSLVDRDENGEIIRTRRGVIANVVTPGILKQGDKITISPAPKTT